MLKGDPNISETLESALQRLQGRFSEKGGAVSQLRLKPQVHQTLAESSGFFVFFSRSFSVGVVKRLGFHLTQK